MEQQIRRRRIADRDRGQRRVRDLTAATGVGMLAAATVFAVAFAGSASADGAVAGTGSSGTSGIVDPSATSPVPTGAGVLAAPVPPPTPARTPPPGGSLVPPTSAPTRVSSPPSTARHRRSASSVSSAGTHARSGGS